ncbi:MAG TPA: hypothetical protein VF176_02705 [Solirubrobacterales bacterium]
MNLRTLLIVAAAAALALAGCGGGGDSDTTASAPVATATTTPSLSKDELIAQGDAICAEVNAAVGAVGSSTDTSGQVGQVADLYMGMVSSLRGLGTSEDDSGYSEVTSAGDALSQAESDVKLADERGDSAALSTAQAEADSALSDFQLAAQSYGFQECGQEPSAPSATSTTTTPSSSATTTTTTPVAPTTPAPTPTPAPSTGGAAGGTAGSTGGGSAGGGSTAGGGTSGGSSGGIGPG